MRRPILENFFHFTDGFLLSSKMQIKSLKSEAEKDFFLKMEYDIFKHQNNGKHRNFVFYSENRKFD